MALSFGLHSKDLDINLSERYQIRKIIEEEELEPIKHSLYHCSCLKAHSSQMTFFISRRLLQMFEAAVHGNTPTKHSA